jgi:hypothetical protein
LKKTPDGLVFLCQQAADVARAVDETLDDGWKRQLPVTVEGFLAKDRANEPGGDAHDAFGGETLALSRS